MDLLEMVKKLTKEEKQEIINILFQDIEEFKLNGVLLGYSEKD